MKINWTVRLKNKVFWLTLIPVVLMLISNIAALFGIELNTIGLSEELTAVVGSIFSVLAVLGVVSDPTTKGVSDSNQAMTYTAPKEDASE